MANLIRLVNQPNLLIYLLLCFIAHFLISVKWTPMIAEPLAFR